MHSAVVKQNSTGLLIHLMHGCADCHNVSEALSGVFDVEGFIASVVSLAHGDSLASSCAQSFCSAATGGFRTAKTARVYFVGRLQSHTPLEVLLQATDVHEYLVLWLRLLSRPTYTVFMLECTAIVSYLSLGIWLASVPSLGESNLATPCEFSQPKNTSDVVMYVDNACHDYCRKPNALLCPATLHHHWMFPVM